MSRSFSFKKFTINDHGCGMPISTDGVLLGAWATLPQQGHIVDIGTGSGLLALMAAQRTQATTITAIELDSTAATAATANFESSPWQPRLVCIEDDITNWYQRIPPASINGIICNPPTLTLANKHNSNIAPPHAIQILLVTNNCSRLSVIY